MMATLVYNLYIKKVESKVEHAASVLPDIQIRGEAKYIFRSDKTRTSNVLNCFKNDRFSKFIGEV